MEAAEQETRLLELSRQRVLPVAVPRPFKTMVELASVVKVTSLVLSGSMTTGPLAVKVWPVATVAPPLAVTKPVAVTGPPKAAVPEPAKV